VRAQRVFACVWGGRLTGRSCRPGRLLKGAVLLRALNGVHPCSNGNHTNQTHLAR
jgi:hypothetical protein